MAVGTRTAPTVAIANINRSSTSVHLIDASGDQYSSSLITPDLVSDINAEAFAAAYQAATQASVWKIVQTIEYVGDRDPDNAGTDQRNTISEGNNLLWKNLATLSSQTPRAVAPILGVMQGNQDIPLLTSAEMVALIASITSILAGYSLESAQFTGRRERKNNPRIKA